MSPANAGTREDAGRVPGRLVSLNVRGGVSICARHWVVCASRARAPLPEVSPSLSTQQCIF